MKISKKNMIRNPKGFQCPAMAIGTYQMYDAENIVYEAIKIGYRHVDTAAVYKNEEQVGRAIQRAIQDGIIERKDIFVTTKVAPKDQGYEKATAAIETSLQKLGLDYIDLMLIHWPGTSKLKPSNPKNKENRLGTIQALKESKKLRFIGVSNFNIEHLEGIDDVVHVNQFELHPLLWDTETRKLFDYCASRSITVGAYSCLGQGNLLHAKEYPELDTVARKHACTIGQVLIQWALEKGCIVMPKASSIERLKENFGAQLVRFDMEDITMIDAIVARTGRVKYCWDPKEIA
jgi:diketogulonate reductase-like aldo/keto reductase